MSEWTSPCGRMTLRLGRWQDVLGDVGECDAVITDPPYSERTHAKQFHGRFKHNRNQRLVSCRGLGFDPMDVDEIPSWGAAWSRIATGWICVFCSHDLVGAWSESMVDRYVFAPIACVQTGMNVRLAGDGPANWTCYMVVARPRTMRGWGALPGAYVARHLGESRKHNPIAGGKPLSVMRDIVCDYSRPGDLIVDPCAGVATTLLAAAMEGRRAIGAEMDPKTYALAVKRLSKGYTERLFREGLKGEQQGLPGTEDPA